MADPAPEARRGCGMSPVTPRCALPVTDPRSNPGGRPQASTRRGLITCGALRLDRMPSRSRLMPLAGDVGSHCRKPGNGRAAQPIGALEMEASAVIGRREPIRKDGFHGGSDPIPARGIDGGADGSASRAPRMNARKLKWPTSGRTDRGPRQVSHPSRYQARPVDFSPCRPSRR